MGKKSRRPNRNNQKDTAAVGATTAVAAPMALNDQLIPMSIFNKLWESRDWEGILKLESTVTRVVNEIENMDPAAAGQYYSKTPLPTENWATRGASCNQSCISEKLSK